MHVAPRPLKTINRQATHRRSHGPGIFALPLKAAVVS